MLVKLMACKISLQTSNILKNKCIQLFSLVSIITLLLGSVSCQGEPQINESDSSLGKLVDKADSGDSEAQFELGYHYYNGSKELQYTTQKSYEEAVKWWRLSAEQGNTKALYNLGICYFYGHGVLKDVIEAVRLYRLAGEQLYLPSLYSLGVCYYNGQGVVKDLKEAYFWFNISAIDGEKSAQRARDLALKTLSETDIEHVQNRSTSWFEERTNLGDQL